MTETSVKCTGCGSLRLDLELFCRKCGNPFIVNVTGEYHNNIGDNFPYISKFILNPDTDTPLISLNEYTWAKEEFLHPTLSYKDRGMNNLFSFLKSNNVLKNNLKVSEDSSGNAGASFAFFSRMLNLDATVFVSKNANVNKISQIKKYGAKVVQVEGNRKDVETAAINSGMMYLGHQSWPEFTDGFRSISYEIYEKAETFPDKLYIPFSTGTLYTGIYFGFKHLKDNNLIDQIPDLVAVMPEKAAGMHNFMIGKENVPQPSIADALTGMIPLRANFMKKIIKENGKTILVTEEEIFIARSELLKMGLDVEFSSAVSYAAKKKSGKENSILILTGHGIKNVG